MNAYATHGELPIITLTVCGEEVETHIDSGSPAGFMLPASLLERTPSSEPVVIGRGRMVGSEFDVLAAKLEGSIELAGHVFENPDVRSTDVIPNANIGYEILKDFRVSIDQRNARIRFAPPETPSSVRPASAPVPEKKARRRLGAAFAPGTDGMIVQKVMKGSVAEKIGLETGDELVRVDSRPLGAGAEALGVALDGDARIVLEVLRDGERLELVVPAR